MKGVTGPDFADVFPALIDTVFAWERGFDCEEDDGEENATAVKLLLPSLFAVVPAGGFLTNL